MRVSRSARTTIRSVNYYADDSATVAAMLSEDTGGDNGGLGNWSTYSAIGLGKMDLPRI